MERNNQQQIYFNRVNIHILQTIAEFLSPKDITEVVMVSRQTRLIFGKVLLKSFEKQKKILKLKEQNYLDPSLDCLKEYQLILQGANKIFSKKSNFYNLLKLLNSNNIEFFKNFFSAVFDRDIKIDKQNLLTQKNGLFQMHNEIQLAFSTMMSSNTIPSSHVKNCYCLGYMSKKVSGVVKFVNRFLKSIEQLQSIENIDRKYKELVSTGRYLQEFNNIHKLSLKNQYQKPIFYLTFRKSYHDYIGFNVNTIILSFLNVYDLQKLHDVSDVFAYQVVNSLDILQNGIQIRQQNIEKIEFAQNTIDAFTLYKANINTHLNKYHICELKAFANPPVACKQTISALMKVFSLPEKDRFSYNIHLITYEKREILEQIDRTQIINFNEKQMAILERYFEEVGQRQIQSQNLFCYKTYIYLKLNYFIQKFNIPQYSIHQYNQYEIQKERLNSHSLQLNNLKKKLLNEQDEQQQAPSPNVCLHPYHQYRRKYRK